MSGVAHVNRVASFWLVSYQQRQVILDFKERWNLGSLQLSK
jgi:hypothetical protein